MLRRVVVPILLSGIICFLGLGLVFAQEGGVYSTLEEYERITGNKIEKFNEAPMLKLKVAAGELPPVEERLPEEPCVIEPAEEIGQYGGVLRGPAFGIHQAHDNDYARADPFFRISYDDFRTVVPNVAKDWKLSEDMKTLTVYLRKGMKWSDGAPFSADDIMFWYEDIILNKELTPVIPPRWSPGGEVMKVEKIDDYTVRFKFAQPYPAVVQMLGCLDSDTPHVFPKHYLKKYHIKYNPKANEIAKEEGYEYWWQCFQFHSRHYRDIADPNRPGIFAWVLEKITLEGDKYFVRNPYYWKVDTAGNQLPYIDKFRTINVASGEIQDLKLMSGELNFAGIFLGFEKYPLYKKGEEQGGYRTVLLDGGARSQMKLVFNMCHNEPVLRDIFNDIRFRQALSLAINREEMNEVLFQGLTFPWQAPVAPGGIFVEEWMGKYYIEYDTERANSLLDEMGLEWDKNHKYRLRPDGKPLTVEITFTDVGLGWITRVELIKEYWEKVGVKTNVKQVDYSYYADSTLANNLDFALWASEPYGRSVQANADLLYPGWGNWWGSPWKMWFDTNGESGEEPPEVVKKLHELIQEWITTQPDSEEYLRLGKEIFTINMENLWTIGDFAGGPSPVIVPQNLRNTAFQKGDVYGWAGQRFWQIYCPQQWFFEK